MNIMAYRPPGHRALNYSVINYVGHGRTLIKDQLWRSNDARRFRIVRILHVHADHVYVMNILTKHTSNIDRRAFTIGVRGWSLEQP